MKYTVAPMVNGDIYLLEGECGFEGFGNFCGWYAKEIISHGKLVGCLDDDLNTPILLTNPLLISKEDDQATYSVYRTTRFEADTIEQAFETFKECVRIEKSKK